MSFSASTLTAPRDGQNRVLANPARSSTSERLEGKDSQGKVVVIVAYLVFLPGCC